MIGYSQRRVIQRRQKILPDIANFGGVLAERVHDETDVLDIQLQKLTFYYLGGLVIAGDSDGLFCGTDRIDYELQNFFQRVLIIRILAAKNFVVDILTNELSLLSPRFTSIRFPSVVLSERSEGKRISITKVSIIKISITTL